jgi:hypothetical protein
MTAYQWTYDRETNSRELSPLPKFDFIYLKLESFSTVFGLQLGSQTFSHV